MRSDLEILREMLEKAKPSYIYDSAPGEHERLKEMTFIVVDGDFYFNTEGRLLSALEVSTEIDKED